ncbi:MAG: hypothetical protein V3R86_08020 [Candidatus Hydrothermarchaeaceae archaeon]
MESLLLKTLGKSPQLRIVDFFLDNRMFDYSKKEIIEEVGMSKTTFYKVWGEIEDRGIVKVARKFGKAKLYKLNTDNELVKNLIEIEKGLIESAAAKVSKQAMVNA